MAENRSSTNQAISTLLEITVEGILAPGTPVTEAELAARLGISRTPIREALRHLVALGLFERKSSHGLRVSPFSLEEAIQVLHIREELECLALRQGAQFIPRSALLALRNRLERQARTGRSGKPFQSSLEEATELHEMIAKACEWPLLRRLMDVLRPHSLRERYFTMQVWRLTPDRQEVSGKAHREHVAIVNALLEGRIDEAERLLRQHIRHVRDLLVERFGDRVRRNVRKALPAGHERAIRGVRLAGRGRTHEGK
jgi:DNA-binding GntR family transcriptional regulator